MRRRITSSVSFRALLAIAFTALAPKATAQPAIDPQAEEVIEAAFRQQIGSWLTEDARRASTVICLSIDQGGVSHSVTADYLKRFRSRPELRRGAECETRKNGAVERATGNPAIVLSIGGVKWITAEEAWVTVRHYRSQLSSGEQPFRVVRELTGWVCLGPILLMPTV